MPYKVVVEYDGCPNWAVDMPDASGSRDDCLFFVANHLPPKGCEFGIVDEDSGRMVSYLLPDTIVPRRRRLQWQDLKTR